MRFTPCVCSHETLLLFFFSPCSRFRAGFASSLKRYCLVQSPSNGNGIYPCELRAYVSAGVQVCDVGVYILLY